MPTSGKLWEGVLPGVLRELYVGRRTGVLTFTRGDERRNVHLRAGHIVNADTTVREDRMGEVLVRHGLLAAADLKRAMGFALRDGKLLGVVLRELGLLDDAGLQQALALHVHAVLSRVFSWPDGSYEFVEEPAGTDTVDDVTLRVSTGDLILEATRSVRDPDVVRYNLGDIDRVLGLSNDPLLRFQRIGLTPADGYVLSRVDGTLSAREVMQLIPLPAEDVLRSLFGLLSTGVVEYVAHLPARPAPPPAPRRKTPPRPAAADAGPPVPAQPPPAAPEETGPAAPSPIDMRRSEVLEAFEGLEARTHFEVLGIAREATEAQVKEAYFRMAKRFHPDVHHDEALHDLRDKLEEVFIRLGEAYEALRNPRIRASYERQLGPPPETTQQAPPAERPEPEEDPRELARMAEQSIRRAARSVAEEKYWEAIQLLETSVPRVEGKMKQFGRILLARAYAKNPNWVKPGEELLLTVIRDDPQSVDAHFHLAAIYRSGGLKARAQAMLRRVLELEPEHAEARLQMDELGGDTPPPPAAPGLIKKLLRKGPAK